MLGGDVNHIFFTRNFCDRTRIPVEFDLLKTREVEPIPIRSRPNSTFVGSKITPSPPAVILIILFFSFVGGWVSLAHEFTEKTFDVVSLLVELPEKENKSPL